MSIQIQKYGMKSISQLRLEMWRIGVLLFISAVIGFAGALPCHAEGGYVGLEVIEEIPFVASSYGARDFTISSDDTIGYLLVNFNEVKLIDIGSLAETGNISCPAFAVNYKALSPDGARLYVPGGQSYNGVSVVDTSSGAIGPQIQISGYRPSAAVINSNGTRVYVAADFGNTVSVIDTATNTVIQTLGVSNYPHQMDLYDNDQQLLVACAWSNEIEVIDTATNAIAATHSLGYSPAYLLVAGNLLFVSDNFQDKVHVIQLTDWTEIDDIDVGDSPYPLALTPDGSYLFVGNAGWEDPSSGKSISVVDVAGGNQAIDTFALDVKPRHLSLTSTGDRLFVTSPDNKLVVLAIDRNNIPVADAGENVRIDSEDQTGTVIAGAGTDEDGDALQYRWLEETVVLSDWADVDPDGSADLDLSVLPYFELGAHNLTLEVSDGIDVSSDTMILTVGNSAPHAAPSGGGVYEIFSPVTLGGQVSDFDGDELTCDWLMGSEILFSETVSTIMGGAAVDLPTNVIDDLPLGSHTLTLRADDGVNTPVSAYIAVDIVDTEAPTLAPLPSRTILWPPNHKMVDVIIEANAADNSGVPSSLSVTVASNEPEEGLFGGDKAPDWTEPMIDEETGVIEISFRSERSGSGDGRVYTVAITATDGSGNSSTASVEIIVPHDRRGKK